jgi:HK97 family phage major capsid protein
MPENLYQIKSLGEHIVGGYTVVFGSPNQTDLEGDWFGQDTDFAFDWYSGNLPIFYEHGIQDANPRKVKIGEVIKRVVDDVGIWIEAKLENTPLAQDIIQKVKSGLLSWSSGSIGHLVRRENNGKLSSWPWVESSLVSTPAETRHTNATLIKSLLDADAQAALERLLGQPNQTVAGGDTTPPILNQTKGNPMLTNIQTIRSIADEVERLWDDIPLRVKSYFKELTEDAMPADEETKAEGEELAVDELPDAAKGTVEEMLAPIADQIIAAIGGDITQEDAMAVLVTLLAQRMQSQTAEVEEEVPEAVMMDTYVEEGAPPMRSNTPAKAITPKPLQRTAKSQNPAAQGAYMVQTVHNPRPRQHYGLARYIKSMVAKDYATVRKMAQMAWSEHVQTYGPEWSSSMKALGLSPDSVGGYLAPVEQSQQIIDLFYDESLFLNTGLATVIPMNTAMVTMPRADDAVSVYWGAENAVITEDQPAFGQETLYAKKLSVLVKISSELIEDASSDVDTFLNGMISRVIGEEVDRVALRGSGVGSEPLGLLNRPDMAPYISGTGTAPSYVQLVDQYSRLEQNKVRITDRVQYIVNPREKASFRKIQNPAGNYVWTDGLQGSAMVNQFQPPRLLGQIVNSTNQIVPVVASNNQTEIYLGDWSNLYLGMRRNMEFAISDQAGFDRDQIWLRCTLRMDVGVGRPQAFQILSDVRAS